MQQQTPSDTTQRTPAGTAGHAADTDSDLLEIDLSTLIKAVLTRWRLCVGLCGSILVLALAYCFLSSPVFLANCRMLIEPGSLKVTQIQDVYDSEFGNDSRSRDAFMTTQIKLLTSDNILAKVFEHFHFDQKEPFSTAREPLRVLEKLIEIKQIPSTSLLDIGFMSTDPVFSAQVSNFLARTYIEDSRQRASGFSRLGLEKLQDELLNMEQNRLKAVEKINAYKQKYGILSVDSAQKLGIARLTSLDEAGVSAQEALATAEATVSAINEWKTRGIRLDSIPDAIQNPTLTQFKMARLAAQGQLLKALQDYGPNHRSVEVQRRIIADIDRSIKEETENSLISAQARLAQGKVRVQIINQERETATNELKHLDQIADEYRMLDDNLKSAEKGYQFVLNRVSELQIARSADSGAGGTFQIIVPAEPPRRAAYPQKIKVMAIALVGSVLLSVLLCILLELLDRTLKRKEDVESITGLSVMGFLPKSVAKDPARNDFIVLDEPKSQSAEAFRALRTSLALSAQARKAKLIAVTSSVEGDGKTYTSINLAVTYARAGKRVLVIDADLRKHRLTTTVMPSVKASELAGLSNLLAGETPLERFADLLQYPLPLSADESSARIAFLPSGPLAPNPAELLSGEAMRPLFAHLLAGFDMVIVDVPPVLAVADARALADVPDMHFLVVTRLLYTEKKQLAMAFDVLRTVDASVIGTVVNGADIESESYGYGYSYGYRYYSYGYGPSHTQTPWWKKLIRKA